MSNTSLNATEEPGRGSYDVDLCLLDINDRFDVIPCILSSICIVFGLIYCFLGYRCFKMVMFFSGFKLGSSAVFLLYHQEPELDAQLAMETKAGIGLGVGVLCGLVTMLVSTMGLFLTGLQLGGLLSVAVLALIGQFHSLTPTWLPVGALLTASIVTAVFTLQWQKPFTVVATAVFGATAVMVCVDYLAENFRLTVHVYDVLCQVGPAARPLCWFSWAITGICPVLSVMGALVQWKVTAHGVVHREGSHKKQKQKDETPEYSYAPSRRRRGETQRRRRPPLLKRYAGDVLAPSYLQSLQERQMGTGSSSSSLSTITHTVIDYDFDTRSTVPLTASSPVWTV